MVTQADIDALNVAIAAGVRSVTVGNQTTTYNTTASLIAARDDMVTQLAQQQNADAAAAGKRASRRTLWHYAGRGY